MKPETIELNAEPVIGILAQVRDPRTIHNRVFLDQKLMASSAQDDGSRTSELDILWKTWWRRR